MREHNSGDEEEMEADTKEKAQREEAENSWLEKDELLKVARILFAESEEGRLMRGMRDA